MSRQALIGIVMGSDSDWPIMRHCAETLAQFGIPYEAKVLSAHRTPDAALDYATHAGTRGMKMRRTTRVAAVDGVAATATARTAVTAAPVVWIVSRTNPRSPRTTCSPLFPG